MAKQTSIDRRSQAAAIREQQRRAERRRSLLIIGAAVLVVLAIIGSTVYAVLERKESQRRAEQAAAAPISGVQSYKIPSRNHVEGTVDYPQNPPAGGNHAPVWVNCAVYGQPVTKEMAVHSMEHGAVWIAYQPDLGSGEVDKLSALADGNDFVLVTPMDGIDSPVVATAWGKQLSVESASDDRLSVFVAKYANGPQTPESGAPCSGGVGG